MICRDLDAVPALPLSRAGSRLQSVSHSRTTRQKARRSMTQSRRRCAAPTIDDPPDVFGEYFLRSLPSAMRLFAAVDRDGAVRAIAGAGAFGIEATVMSGRRASRVEPAA